MYTVVSKLLWSMSELFVLATIVQSQLQIRITHRIATVHSNYPCNLFWSLCNLSPFRYLKIFYSFPTEALISLRNLFHFLMFMKLLMPWGDSKGVLFPSNWTIGVQPFMNLRKKLISYIYIFTCVALAKAGLVMGPLCPSLRLSVGL